jgi:lysozyme
MHAGNSPSARPAGKVVGVGAIVGTIIGAACYFAAPFEGRLHKPYIDPVGVLTVCEGHTGPDIVRSHAYTDAECDALTRKDMTVANGHVQRCLGPLPPGPEIAFTMAANNVGPRIVCGSTLQKLVKAGDIMGACAQLSRWDRAGGKVMRGLSRRRAAERAICEGRTRS